ncbi:MAG: PfkB family carbohydrate kinase [Phycisphaerae bacterium]|jgi:sugar/nucleoside kinase (ribokinase family)
MALAVTGTIGIDTIRTPSGGADRILGGSGTYFSAAASLYGAVRLVAAVGDDFPAAFRGVLEHFNPIDLAGLETRAGSKTFAWGGKYLADMNSRETLFTELGVLAEAPPKVPAKFSDSKFLFLANTHPAVQLGFIDQFPHRTLTVADTMDLWINIAKAELTQLLTRVDGLVLNYDEAELFTGKRNPVTAGRHLLGMGPRFVVIKKGEHGALLIHRDGIAALPAYPTEDVVDPTGCGDSFAGGMMGCLANPTGWHHVTAPTGDPGSFDSIRKALVHGTVVASFNIEAFSLDRLKALTPAELSSRYAKYVAMTSL